MSWIQTYSGKKFYPADPKAGDVDLLDIAHALSNICRFGGHCGPFYSVAQHSVLVSQNCSAMLWGLLHDASEAYLCDLPRPTKKMLRERGVTVFDELEAAIQQAICKRFGLPVEQPECVTAVDLAMLATERREMMRNTLDDWNSLHGVVPFQFIIHPWSPSKAKHEFLERFHELTESKR